MFTHSEICLCVFIRCAIRYDVKVLFITQAKPLPQNFPSVSNLCCKEPVVFVCVWPLTVWFVLAFGAHVGPFPFIFAERELRKEVSARSYLSTAELPCEGA